MVMKTSLLITGDASVAKAEVAALASAVEKLGTGAKTTAAPIAVLDQAQKAAAGSAREVAAATVTADQAQAAIAQSAGIAAAAQAQLAAAQGEAAAGARGLAQALAIAEAAQVEANAGARDAAAIQAAATAEMAKLAATAGQLGSVLAALGAAGGTAGDGADRAGAGTSAYAAQLARLRAELDPVGEAQRKLATTTDLLDTAFGKGDIDAEQYAVGLGRAAAAAGGTARAQAVLDAAMAAGTISAEQLAVGMKAAANATHGHAGASVQMGSAGLIADHVVRSLSDSIAAGQSPIRAITMEMGRVTEAMTLFAVQSGNAGGALGKFAAFMGGPMGIALQIGVALLTPLIAKLFDQGDAADAAGKKTMELQDALRQYGAATEEVRKSIEDYNDAQRRARENDSLSIDINLRLADAQLKRAVATRQATQAQLSQAIALATANRQPGIGGVAGTAGYIQGAGDTAVAGLRDQLAAEQGSIGTILQTQRNLFISQAKKTAEDAVDPVKRLNDQYDRMRDTAIHAAAGNTALAKSLGTTLTSVERRRTSAVEAERQRQRDAKRKPKKAKSTAGLERFGETAGIRIADMIGQYNPDTNLAALEKTNKAIRGIDDLIADLGRRKPLGFEDLIASAEKAKVTVREGIVAELVSAFEKPKTLGDLAAAAFAKLDVIEKNAASQKYDGFREVIAFVEQKKGVINDALVRPYQDYIKAQRDDLAVMQLQAAGLDDQAAALKQIQSLEKNGTVLNQAQKDAILDTVEAMRAEQRQIDINRAHTQLYLDALGGIKTVVEDATQAFVRGDLGQLLRTPGKLLDVFNQLREQQLFENLFGGAFRDLQDQVNGLSPMKQASQAMASALATIAPHVETAGTALDSVAPPTKVVADAFGTLASQADAASRALGAIGSGAGSAVTTGSGDDGSASGAGGTNDAGDVIVIGSRVPKVSIDSDIVRTIHSIAEIGKGAAPSLARSPQSFFEESIAKITTPIVGLFTNEKSAAAIGEKIGKFSGKAFSGAATGTLVAGIGDALGLGLSKQGAQIGGAIGGVLSFIPGGSIIGSLAGGLLGKLFAPKAQPGGVTVSAANGSAGVTGTVGSDKAGISAGNSLGAQVASSINQIVDQLGGTLGSFNVEIGKYKNSLRVNTNGRALGGVKGSGAVDFGDDEAAAVSYAVAQAIAQGAVTGLDAAITKALQSSTDVNAALKEALNVSALETFIGGTAAAVRKQFDTEKRTADARVALAQKYGLDVLATEKANADERTKLAADLLKQQVGSLQQLVTSLTSGDLFEGSALDKLTAINSAITKAKTDLDAGVDGAADVLAGLYQQKLTASKDAYGTTSAYAADRDSILSDARTAVANANAQILASAGKSDPALATTNTALDENNDQNAQIIAALGEQTSILSRLGSSSSQAFDLSALAAV